MSAPTVHWLGAPVPPSLKRLLTSAGFGLSTSGGEGPTVYAGARPQRAEGRGWVWAPETKVSLSELREVTRAGAIDVVRRDVTGWEARVLSAVVALSTAEPPLPPAPGFVAESAVMKQVLRRVLTAAQSSMPVLLTGETGTGKELAARLVHRWSPRRAKTFVPINCAAIPNELMEGELFGYVRGAFSGAARDYDGQLMAGHGGVVFLDEIDETPHALQVKLLRVLEDRVVSRLGENVWRTVDFRLVAATNRDLKALIADGTFGDDLYERLSTIQIELPPLRERLDDLPALVKQLLARYASEEGEWKDRPRVTDCTDEALELLRAYPWPGNVRELKNVIFGALVAKRHGTALVVSDLPRRLLTGEAPRARYVSPGPIEARIAEGSMDLSAAVEELERVALSAALRRANGNAAEAARLLGRVGRGQAKDPGGTVRTMMKRLGVAAPSPRNGDE